MKPCAVIVTPLIPTGPVVGLRLVADWVTLKVVAEVAELVPSETAAVWEACGDGGMVNVIVELPVESELPPPVIEALTPPTVTVRAWDAMKPVATICVEVPTTPLVGDRPVAAAFTV